MSCGGRRRRSRPSPWHNDAPPGGRFPRLRRAVSSGVEHDIHTVGVGGSKPSPPTNPPRRQHIPDAPVKVATWNINGVVRRLPLLVDWLSRAKPDVVALQETKATDAEFPKAALAAAGYGAITVGQRPWNGVALLARGTEPVMVRRALPGDPGDTQARYVEAAIEGILFASIYLPNGNPQPGPKFAYKLAWFERLIEHAATLQASGHPVVL